MTENTQNGTAAETPAANAEPTPAAGAPAPTEAAKPADPAGSLQERVARLEEELKAEKERVLRLSAEMANYRKRQEKEKANWHRMNTREIVLGLLEPVDNLALALDAARKAKEAGTVGDDFVKLIQGVEMVLHQVQEGLKAKGVAAFHPHGEKFDPNVHEAFAHVETDQCPEGHVALVFRSGYRLDDQVIRPPLVQVAKAPSRPSGATDA